MCADKGLECSPIEIYEADVGKFDFQDADIIFAAAVCFPNSLLETIADNCAYLKKGTRIMMMNYLPEREYIHLQATCMTKFTWGIHEVRFYEVL